MRRILFLFVLLSNFFLYAEDVKPEALSPDFIKFMDIDDQDMALIKSDFKDFSYTDYFYLYCVASGDMAGYESYKKWFSNVDLLVDIEVKKDFGRADIYNLSDAMQKKFAESLLVYLHKFVFKRYDLNANVISQITAGEYNCVSSSILYAIFLKKYGLQCIGIETPDHVFIQVKFQNDGIDVETTNPYGFDPGRKKDVLDQFGKTTGFTYVPAIDYKNRNAVDLKKVFILIYHNLAQINFNKGDYIRAMNLGYMIYKGRSDERGFKDFNDIFNNYIAVLFNSKKYNNAIDNIESYFEIFDMNEYFVNIRFDMMYQIVYEWTDYKNFAVMKEFLEAKNEKYPEIRNARRYADIVFNFYLKTVLDLNKRNDFDQSYKLIKEYNSKYKNADMEKLFSNTITDQIIHANKTDTLPYIQQVLTRLKTEFPDYLKTVNNSEKIFNLQNFYSIFRKGDYERSLAEAKKMKSLYPGDKDFVKNLYSAYLQYTIDLYNKKEIDRLISYCDEALLEFPGDKLLDNNYKAFFINFFEESFAKKDYSNARKIINKALEKYPSQSEIINCDIRLKEKNY